MKWIHLDGVRLCICLFRELKPANLLPPFGTRRFCPMIEPTITTELVAKHNLTLDGTTHINLVTHPERVCEPPLGSDDGKWILVSILAALKNKTVAQAA